MENLKQTSLHQHHVELGARMVDFGGWSMPVQYQNLKEEALAVREKAGVFDVSHMGEFYVTGPQALKFASLDKEQIDLWECHEAFAAVPMSHEEQVLQYGCPIGTLSSELSKEQDHEISKARITAVFDVLRD